MVPWLAPEEGEAEFECLSHHAGECVPHRSQAVEAAHGMVPGLHAVAWDLVITPEGSRLQEGVGNWDVVTPQRDMGGCWMGRVELVVAKNSPVGAAPRPRWRRVRVYRR